MIILFHRTRRRKSILIMVSLFIAAFLLTLCPLEAAEEYDEGGSGGQIWDLFWRIVNFGILIFILYKLLAKPLKGFLNQRQISIKEALEKAVQAKEEAEVKYKGMEEKLSKASEEIAEIKKLLADQGRVEKEKIIDLAKKEAENIKKQTQIAVEQEIKKAQFMLRNEAVELASKMAEAILIEKVDEKDHDRLINEYLEKVVSQD